MSRLDRIQGILRWGCAAMLLATVATQVLAQADPPARVGLLNYREGSVAFSPLGDSEWMDVPPNRPLTQGDRLWADRGSRAEVHAGAIAIRLDGQTHVAILALDDRVTRLSVPHGAVQVRLRELLDGDNLQLDTPNLSFRAVQAGEYRLDVDSAGGTTRVTVHSGTGVAYGENGQTLALGGGQQVVFRGRALVQVNAQEAPPQDGFDRWASDRDRREDQSISARYVPREVTGYQELDSHGRWSRDAALGPVWTPHQDDPGWAPFRFGRWDSVAPWGWTWLDDAPWGFATSHYGRWAVIAERWAWVPGRMPARPVYAPALVAFAGNAGASGNVRLATGRLGVAWFALGPGEPWQPAFGASPVYVSTVNRNMAAVEPATGASAHRRTEAITAVTLDDFQPGWPIRGKLQRLAPGEVARSQAVAPPPHSGRPGPPPLPELQLARIVAPRPAPAVAAAPPAAAQQQPVTITSEQVQVALGAQQNERARREEAARAVAQAQAQREQAQREQARRAVQAQLAREKAHKQRVAAQREAALREAQRRAQVEREQAQARAERQARAQQQAKLQRDAMKQEQARRAAQLQARAQADARTQAEAKAQAEADAQARHDAQVRRALALANADMQARREAQERRDAQARRDERERLEQQRRQLQAPFTAPWPQQQPVPLPRDRRS
ncbi:MAG: putative chromosome segregation ATPase [Ramlibacter sp.]|nr:putative chromosome segregation ATPase [Ramlibacter sp.]